MKQFVSSSQFFWCFLMDLTKAKKLLSIFSYYNNSNYFRLKYKSCIFMSQYEPFEWWKLLKIIWKHHSCKIEKIIPPNIAWTHVHIRINFFSVLLSSHQIWFSRVMGFIYPIMDFILNIYVVLICRAIMLRGWTSMDLHFFIVYLWVFFDGIMIHVSSF